MISGSWGNVFLSSAFLLLSWLIWKEECIRRKENEKNSLTKLCSYWHLREVSTYLFSLETFVQEHQCFSCAFVVQRQSLHCMKFKFMRIPCRHKKRHLEMFSEKGAAHWIQLPHTWNAISKQTNTQSQKQQKNLVNSLWLNAVAQWDEAHLSIL